MHLLFIYTELPTKDKIGTHMYKQTVLLTMRTMSLRVLYSTILIPIVVQHARAWTITIMNYGKHDNDWQSSNTSPSKMLSHPRRGSPFGCHSTIRSRFPSPLPGRTPLELIRPPQSSQTQIQHQDLVRTPCKAWHTVQSRLKPQHGASWMISWLIRW